MDHWEWRKAGPALSAVDVREPRRGRERAADRYEGCLLHGGGGRRNTRLVVERLARGSIPRASGDGTVFRVLRHGAGRAMPGPYCRTPAFLKSPALT